MKKIPLTQGQYALVDDADYDEVNKHNWQAMYDSHSKTYYAIRSVRRAGKKPAVMMHAFITGNRLTDHINHDGLDNQRSNLREVTYSQNACNTRPRRGSSSQYKGVTWDKGANKWRVQIMKDGVMHRIGRYVSEEEAALAYNEAARELHGEYAYLNDLSA